MKALGQVAIATGGDLTQMMQEMGNLALQMGEKFGISSKLLGKDLGYMTQNMGKFGSMTKTQMITSAVYVRKLGLEIKDIEGLMGAFDNFEDAATNAAKLAQGFGMTIDAMKMMKEQDPAKRLDMLRQSFAATGRSIESMSRQEKAMLASSAGLDENMVSLALSSKNMGKSYDDIQKEADKSNKKQLSQAEVMDKLSENIKKFTEAMQTSGSFLTQFFNGIMKGLSKSPEFMKLMRSLGHALHSVYLAGVEVGKMIMKFFPGLSEMASNLADLFSGAKFKDLLGGVVGAFKTFFEDLQKDPVNAVGKFMKTIKEKFMNFFDKDSKEGKGFLGGLGKFGKAAGGIVAGIGKFLIEGAVSAIKGLIDFIKNPSGLTPDPDSFVSNFFSPILQVIKEQGPVLLVALKDLFFTLLEKFGPWLAGIAATLFAANVAKALVMGVVAGAAQAGGMALMQKALKGFGMDVVKQAAPPPDANVGPEKGLMEKLKEGIDVLKDIETTDILKAGAKMLLLAAFVSVAMVEFALGMAAAATVMSLVSMTDVVKAFMAVTAGLMASIALILVSKLLEPASILSSIPGILAAAAFVAVGILAFSGAVALAAMMMSTVSWDSIVKAFAAVAMGILATVALIAVGASLGSPPALLALGWATLGLLAGAAFVAVGITAYAGAVKLATLALGDIPLEQVTTMFKSLGMAILATQTLLATGAIFAVLAAEGYLLAATGGMIAAAVFMSVGIYAFVEGLKLTVAALGDFSIEKVTEVLEMVGIGVMAAFGLLSAGGIFAALAFFAGTALVMAAAGVYGLALFFSTVLPLFAPALQAVVDMPMANPEEVSEKIGAIGSIIQAMAAVGQLGIDAAAAASAAGAFGPGIGDTIKAMSGFIRDTKDVIVSLVSDLVGTATKWTKKELEKVKVMADLVGGIANMAGAMAGPMSALASADTSWTSDNSSEKMKAITEGISRIMESMRLQLPAIVHAMARVSLGEKEISFTKIKKISEIVKAMGPLMQTVSGMVRDIAGIKGDGFGGTDAAEKMGTIGTAITNIFSAITSSFPGIVSMVSGLTGTFANMKELPSAIDSMVSTIKVVIAAVGDLVNMDISNDPGLLQSFMGSGKKNTLADVFEKLDSDLAQISSGTKFLSADRVAAIRITAENLSKFRELQLGGVVSAVVEDIKAINDSLANLGDIDVNATVDHLGEALQLKTEVLNIERKPIQMTVNLNLTMKAEDIAKEILEVSQKATLKSDSKLYHQVRDFLNIS